MERQRILAVVQTDLQLICSMRAALEESGLGILSISRNSQEAILYLRGVGVYGDRTRHPVPALVVLDCSNTDGADLEVLAWMRERPEYCRTPVIMLCNSEQQHAHIACALDNSCLLVERGDLNELADAVGTLGPGQIFATAAA